MGAVPIWLSTEDAAEFLGVNAVTVRRCMMRGELPATEVDGVIRFKLADLGTLVIPATATPQKRPTGRPSG
jgi:excisionase family DNA binding protein